MSKILRRYGVLLASALLVWAAGPAGGSAILHLSTMGLGEGVPTPANPRVVLNVGESTTLYLWAELASASSTFIGLDFVPTGPGVINFDSVSVPNPIVFVDSETQESLYRWNGYNLRTGSVGGFDAIGGLNDPVGYNALGLKGTNSQNDPTRVGAASPYNFLVASVTITGKTVGITDIFMTISDVQIGGNAGFVGTPAAPALQLGVGDAALPVSVYGSYPYNTYYVAEGVASTVADATITVVPEPGTLALLALAALALLQRAPRRLSLWATTQTSPK